MKTSIYNNFIPHKDKILGYNVLSNKFILLEPELYQIFESYSQKNKIDELIMIHPEFYNFMISEGFFVKNQENEFEKVKALQQKIDNNDEMFDLFINPTMNCNFKCWYCYETHIKNSKMSSEMIGKVMKLTNNILNTQPNLKLLYLSWFGGEPLLQYKDVVLPLLKKLNAFCVDRKVKFNSGFTTNGLLINQKMIDDFKSYNVSELQITLDGIKPLHDKIRYISKSRGSYDEIVNNIILLAKNNIKTIVRINCTDKTLEELDSIIGTFSVLATDIKKNLSFTLHRVWQIEDSLDVHISQFIKKNNGKDFLINGTSLDSFRDSCYADKKNQAIINYNGDVFKCTARKFSLENREGYLNSDGNIIWNEKYYQRMNGKLKNPPCLTCRILPICGGGCSQMVLEKKKNYCIYNFDEKKKDQLIIDIFSTRVLD